MATLAHTPPTAAGGADRLVAQFAPLLKGGLRLPNYKRPEVTWQVTPACHPDFAAGIRAAWARLDLNDRTQFSEEEALVLRYQRLHGFAHLYRKAVSGPALLRPAAEQQEEAQLLLGLLGILIGEKLLELLGPAEVARWFPYHGVNVQASTSLRAWTLRCDSLLTHVTADGRCFYYVSAKPTVSLRGKRRIVAFSAHAIERIAERVCATLTVRSYTTLGDIFAWVQHYRYCEPALLHPR